MTMWFDLCWMAGSNPLRPQYLEGCIDNLRRRLPLECNYRPGIWSFFFSELWRQVTIFQPVAWRRPWPQTLSAPQQRQQHRETVGNTSHTRFRTDTQPFSSGSIQPSVAWPKLITHIHCTELLNLRCMKELQRAEEEKETAAKTHCMPETKGIIKPLKLEWTAGATACAARLLNWG